MFGIQLRPSFCEEWNIGLQVMQSGLECYAVHIKDFEHHNRVSLDKSLTVNYLGRKMAREDKLKNTERTL